MIKVDRASVAKPLSLTAANKGENKDKTELDLVRAEYERHVTAGGAPETFSYDFKAYKSDDVKQALEALFLGKCAYCESRYASTQPMDVEHWRPKAVVYERDTAGKRRELAGYWWLASEWSNLLPSCIDCNRPRKQHDNVTELDATMGKGNQFPVVGGRMSPPDANVIGPGVEEVALLLDPTVDEPTEHLTFHDDGRVTGVPGSIKGAESIRVYALNRAELAFERWGLAALIEQRLWTIETLAGVIAEGSLPEESLLDLQDLVAHEIDALLQLAEPGRPYSAMARQLIDRNAPPGLDTPSAPPPTDDVKAILLRFENHDDRTDHVAVGARLTELGFVPHVPRSKAGDGPSDSAYLRWVATGKRKTVRLYQNSAGLVSDSRTQLAVASTTADARPVTGTHPRVVFYYADSSVAKVLAAAATLRDWADVP